MPAIGRADYQERREARAERLAARAVKRREDAEATSARARQMQDRIPFGQPILVGHHSERGHRRDLERINGLYTKSAESLDAADAAERSLEAMASNRAISSDDPESLDRLKAKLAHIEANRVKAVDINKAIRKAKGDNAKALAALQALGYSPADSAALLTPDFCGRTGIPPYKLTNWGSEARRVKQRIESLETKASREPMPDEVIGDVTITERDNRVQLFFPGKPSDEIRARLKSNGFRWSPTAGSWQRMPSAWAWHVAREIAKAVQP